MNKRIEFYTVDPDYIEYLKLFDKRVSNIDYENAIKPFLGIDLDDSTNYIYLVPLTSAKPNLSLKSEGITFMKLYDYMPATNKRIKFIGGLQINNMIPVPREELIKLDYSTIDSYKSFDTRQSKRQYANFLNKEKYYISMIYDKIIENAKRVRYITDVAPKCRIANYSCDFRLLENQCFVWQNLNEREKMEYLGEIHAQSIMKKTIETYSTYKLFEMNDKIYCVNLDGDYFFSPEDSDIFIANYLDMNNETGYTYDSYIKLLLTWKDDIVSDYNENLRYLSNNEYEFLINVDKLYNNIEIQTME